MASYEGCLKITTWQLGRQLISKEIKHFLSKVCCLWRIALLPWSPDWPSHFKDILPGKEKWRGEKKRKHDKKTLDGKSNKLLFERRKLQMKEFLECLLTISSLSLFQTDTHKH